MSNDKLRAAIAVLGTFDSKGAEHLFLKEAIERRELAAITINVGTKGPSPFTPDYDLRPKDQPSRDLAIGEVITAGRRLVQELSTNGRLAGIISAGGGSGTHIATSIMKVLPFGTPKVMVSTVAARDMSNVVGTRDVTMIHSVGDLLGINSVTGPILEQAAGAVCGMAQAEWKPLAAKKRIALTMFGFITQAAENIKACLEAAGHEVIAFHANGAGGLAMEELADEGRFDAILDLATHELADSLKPGGYCNLIGPGRLRPHPGVPRLVVPGGLDCAVLCFTRDDIPEEYRDRQIFFYDFRSAIRLSAAETRLLTADLAARLNRQARGVRVLVPLRGWSEADRVDGPLFDPDLNQACIEMLRADLDPQIEIKTVDLHINDLEFARIAYRSMAEMLTANNQDDPPVAP